MEDKDPKDDELNQEGQDDINDADDSFGLPDLDYKPLEESEEDTVETESEDPADTNYSDDLSDESSDDVHYREMEESPKEQPERRFSSYRQQESSSKGPKIVIAIVAIIVVAAGIWYFGFYGPAEAERARVEQAEADRIEKQRQEELAAQQRQREEEAAARAAAEVEEEASLDDVSEKGQVSTISEPTSRYYVVIGSFIDVDLAMDLGKELAANGINTTLISPYSKKRLFRLAVANYGSFGEAASAINDLKAEYGENLWVLKY